MRPERTEPAPLPHVDAQALADRHFNAMRGPRAICEECALPWPCETYAVATRLARVTALVLSWPAYEPTSRSDYGQGVGQCRQALLEVLQ